MVGEPLSSTIYCAVVVDCNPHWSVTVNKEIVEHGDKISYLQKALRNLTVAKNCISCFGYGLHTDKRPMEQMDAIHGMRTIPCPECNANLNGVNN